MPIGVNVNNPQSQLGEASVTPTTTISYGGNSLGGLTAATSTSSGALGVTSASFSNILLYGCIGLGAIFILKRFD